MDHIHYDGIDAVLDDLIFRYPVLAPVKEDIRGLYLGLEQTFAAGHKLLICGNGGSAADALHIVGELMKSFTLPRPVSAEVCERLRELFPSEADALVSRLEGALPAIALVENASLNTALVNDVESTISFAQQVYGLGNEGDMLLCISTSGNARNCLAAAMTAKAKGMKVGFLGGKDGGKLLPLSDMAVVVPDHETFRIQELHLPVYHALCLMLEYRFFG